MALSFGLAIALLVLFLMSIAAVGAVLFLWISLPSA
jgi:hypothetical protein